MAKHHFSETQHDAMNISDVCPIMPHVFYLNSRYLSYWNPHQIIGQLHGLLIADHRQFSIWSTTDGVVPKRSHREPNSFANFQSEKKFNSAWSSSRPNKIRKYEVPSSQSFFRQFLSSKQYFVGFNIFGRWRHDIESLRQVGDGCTCALTLPKVVWFSCRNNKHFALQFQPRSSRCHRIRFLVGNIFRMHMLLLMTWKRIWSNTLILNHDVSLYHHVYGKLDMKNKKQRGTLE